MHAIQAGQAQLQIRERGGKGETKRWGDICRKFTLMTFQGWRMPPIKREVCLEKLFPIWSHPWTWQTSVEFQACWTASCVKLRTKKLTKLRHGKLDNRIAKWSDFKTANSMLGMLGLQDCKLWLLRLLELAGMSGWSGLCWIGRIDRIGQNWQDCQDWKDLQDWKDWQDWKNFQDCQGWAWLARIGRISKICKD